MEVRKRSEKSPAAASQKNDRQRVQLDFSPEAYARLQQLREMADASSNAEVVRRALQLFEFFLLKKSEGYELQITKEDSVTQLAMLV